MKILVISIAGIGDCLIASPMIKQLKKSYPNSRIDVFVMWEQAKKLLENNPYISKIYQFNMPEKGYIKSLLFTNKLRKENFDISINTHPQSKIQYRITARLINAKTRISHLYDNKNWLDRFLVNKTLEQDYNINSIDNNLKLLELLNIKPDYKEDYEIFLSKEDKKKADEFIKRNELKGRLIGFHVGSGSTKNLKLKRWPVENYISLIKLILKNKQARILLFGGDDEEAENNKIFREVNDKGVIIVKTNNIRQSAAIIGKCSLFISVDSVLMHIAAAMKVKQIVIAGPTYDKCVEPKRKPTVISARLECAPCYRYDGKGVNCLRKEFRKCLREIRPKMVYAELEKILENKKNDSLFR